MTKDQDESSINPANAQEVSAQEASGQEGERRDNLGQQGNPFGGSPTFPDPAGTRPTGDATGFNGSYTETEHHTQREYDAENQHPESQKED